MALIQRARELVKELEKEYPIDSLMRLYWLASMQSSNSGGDVSQALKDLKIAAPYELGAAASFISYLYPACVRGQA